MAIFWTADLHFGHKNIIESCSRPFTSTEEMDEHLVAQWNATVSPEDTVYVLGDLCMPSTRDDALPYVMQLLGDIHLVRGNHDRYKDWPIPMKAAITDHGDRHEILMKGARDGKNLPIVMDHYALRTWNRKHYGAIQLFGHSHGNLSPLTGQLDVGVDNAKRLLGDYRPFSFEDILEHIKWPEPEVY